MYEIAHSGNIYYYLITIPTMSGETNSYSSCQTQRVWCLPWKSKPRFSVSLYISQEHFQKEQRLDFQESVSWYTCQLTLFDGDGM